MPAPVTAWVLDGFPDAKSLNIACYDCATSNVFVPNGISFAAFRPLLFENYAVAGTVPASSAGSQSSLATSGSVTASQVIYDTAGYQGQYADQPAGTGYYQFTPVVPGSSGDGETAGGWGFLSHFAALNPSPTQQSVGADMLGTNLSPVSGSRQATSGSHDSCAFFLDLVDTSGVIWSPAITVRDSSATTGTLAASTTGASGEGLRFCSIWAAASASTQGQQVFSPGGVYPFTAPDGVDILTASPTGAGAGGGAGNSSGGGVEFGGGGGGGGEFAQSTIGVTGGDNYVVQVGLGGAGGTSPGGSGANGGNSVFTGDLAESVTGHGGTLGTGATTSANGTGGGGGAGSGAVTHHHGGAGANGSTASYGGGGGASAGTGQAGSDAMGATPGAAPTGGGPGGAGGAQGIGVVQKITISGNTSNTLPVTFRNPVQAGNTVIVAVTCSGTGAGGSSDPPPADPTCALSDGTPMTTEFVTGDSLDLPTAMQVALFDIYNVTGGQAGFTVTSFGAHNRVMIANAWEVTGLGPTPSIDVSNTKDRGGSSGGGPQTAYNIQKTTTQAPELWIGVLGAQGTAAFNINAPTGQGWTLFDQNSNSANSVYSRTRAGYQVQDAAGIMTFDGTFSVPRSINGVSYGAIVVSYITSATLDGDPPITPPGGGGGGGLGAANSGGGGSDGQVILTWDNPPGAGYGFPAAPVPYTAWTPDTTVGITSLVDANVNTSVADVLNFLACPPVFRVASTGGTVSSSSLNTLPFTGATPTVDSYSGWTGGTVSTYTVQQPGLYLMHGLAAFGSAAAGNRQCGAIVNGTNYWGAPAPAAAAGGTYVAKTQVFSLQAGDTVQFGAYQTSGSPLALSGTDQTRFFLAHLGGLATAGTVTATQWQPPDTTFRFAKGTSGEYLGGNLAAQLQQHLGSDLAFLVNRPYLLAYQTVAQTGLPVGSFSTITLDTVGSPVHAADSGDNYSGWAAGAANAYTAQVSGWYLVVGEFFAAQGASTGNTVTAALAPDRSGGVVPPSSPDWYQQNTATTSATFGAGATVFGVVFLGANESVAPMIKATSYGAPYATLSGTVRGGTYASHLECIWLSE